MTTQEMIAENNRLRKKIAEMQAEIKAYKDKISMLEEKENDIQVESQRLLETIAELNVEVEELELELSTKESFFDIVNASNKLELPREPISVAEMLINAERKCEPCNFVKRLNDMFGSEPIDTYRIYDVSELRQIAEHLLIYCKANEENAEVEEPKEEQQKPKTKIKKSDYMFFDGRNLGEVKEFIGKDRYINTEKLSLYSASRQNGITMMGSIDIEYYGDYPKTMVRTTIVPVRNYIVKIDGEYFSATPDEFEKYIEVEDDE